MQPQQRATQRKGRVRRRLFVPGMVVLVLSLVAWAASMWVMGYRHFRNDGSGLTVSLDRGELLATTEATYWGPGWAVLTPLDAPFPLARMSWWPYNGAVWSLSEYGWRLQLPLWMPALLGLAMAAGGSRGWWRHRAARRRRKRGLCEGCGYDMTGSAGKVCPECGLQDPESQT